MSMSPGVIRVYTIDSEKPRGDEPIKYVCMYVHVRKILKMFTKLETEAFTSQQQVGALKHLL